MEGVKGETKFAFEPLNANHDRAAFSCGIPALDAYLKSQAHQDAKKNLAVVFVCTPDKKTIAGYYALSQYTVQLDAMPEEIARKLTKHREVPAALIGRLARSVSSRGMHVGEMLLMDALKRALRNSRQVASWAVIVDAKDARSATFYRKYGFMEIPQVPTRLFLPMATVDKMFVDAGINVEE